MTTGEKINKLLVEKEISMRKMAELTNVNESTISLIVADKRNVSKNMMTKLCKYLNVSEKDIIGDEKVENKKDNAVNRLLQLKQELTKKDKDKIFDELFSDRKTDNSKEIVRLTRDSNTFKLMYKGASDRLAISERERKDYERRCLKAIEYAENDLKSFIYSIEYKTLLRILKGEFKDEEEETN